MTVKTEQATRRDLINPSLEKAGWNLKDRTRVIEEVDIKQSDFKRRDYKTIDESLRSDVDSAYVDYGGLGCGRPNLNLCMKTIYDVTAELYSGGACVQIRTSCNRSNLATTRHTWGKWYQ
jgi:hypothetical protein